MFDPSRAAALDALAEFVPRAGRTYAELRNADEGPGARQNVSQLSPWIRVRQLAEEEVVRAVLEQHDVRAAGKFIDEVCWRTYWKGWLQLRPSIWTDYRRRVAELSQDAVAHDGVAAATSGETGIDCFDAWARELVDTGYLHNHARMWLASIWIHTLRLPWELGADWFLRHLLDGDPASNTLSWRWVAGLQTAGKTYLATRENIRRYTGNRFAVNTPLATEPRVLTDSLPAIQPLAPPDDLNDAGRVGLLLTEDDLGAADWIGEHTAIAAVGAFFPTAAYAEMNIAEPVVNFRRAALNSRCAGVPNATRFDDMAGLREWLRSTAMQTLVLADPPVGIGSEGAPMIESVCAECDVAVRRVRNAWDALLWPRATHGFFRFKKAIPEAVSLARRLS
jgi:deoxyribodipyrimidine photo-lyase